MESNLSEVSETYKSGIQFKTAINIVAENEKEKSENNNRENIFDAKSTNNTTEKIEMSDEPLKAKDYANTRTIRCYDKNQQIKASLSDKSHEHLNEFLKRHQTTRHCIKNPTVFVPIDQTTHNSVKKNDNFLKLIESLYRKYFNNTTAQNNIFVMANILNIIRISDEHHKKWLDLLVHDKMLISQKPNRHSYSVADAIHLRHSYVLKSKFKKYFLEVFSDVVYSHFELAFKMFFSSLYTVFQVLQQPNLNENTFDNLLQSLCGCFKDNEDVIAVVMLTSETFLPDCINLLRVIEDKRGSDPNITYRMSLFFLSSANNQSNIFQKVINTVTSDSNENLAPLIDNAAFQCFINSTFITKSTSNVKQNENIETPMTSNYSTIIQSDETPFATYP